MSNTRKLPPPAGSAPAAPGEDAGQPEERTVRFMGQEFRLADKISAYAVMKFQRFSNSADPRVMEAFHALLEQAIHPDDWTRFEDLALSSRADDEDLIEVINAAAETMMLYVARREHQRRRAAPQDHKPPARPRQQPGRK